MIADIGMMGSGPSSIASTNVHGRITITGLPRSEALSGPPLIAYGEALSGPPLFDPAS